MNAMLNSYSNKEKKCHFFFSFNDLLMIIAALCLLSTIFIPLILRVRSTVKTTICAENLMKLAQANNAYSLDSKRYAPAAIGKTLRWYGIKQDPKDQLFEWEQSPLYSYIENGGSLKICPALKAMMDPEKLSKVWGYQSGGFGYGYNENLGSLRFFSASNYWDKDCQELGIEKEKVSSPEKTLMFVDTATKLTPEGERMTEGSLAEFAFARSYDFINKSAVQPWGTPIPSTHFRHNKMANAAWCDGHVSKEVQTYSKGRWGEFGIGFFGEKENNFFNPVK